MSAFSAPPDEYLQASPREGHLVWDRFIRVFHWSLAASVTIALISGLALDATWSRLHLVSGTFAVALVSARIVWGFTGPAYARFSGFVPSRQQVVAHLKRGTGHMRHLGHNPLGALMVLALLALILGLGATGLAALGSGLKTGPLAAILPASQGGVWSEIHEAAALALLGLIVLHLGGVIFESRRSGENLPRAMITGRKTRRMGDIVAPARTAHPVVVVLSVSGLLLVSALAVTDLSQRPLSNPPVALIPPVYSAECAACHMAYHPATRPAASWQVMMTGLQDHFGEDASLPQETAAQISTWLRRHAADTTDSKPATLWAGLRDTTPVALPDTAQWKRLHDSVDADIFRRAPIYSRSNCVACHADAETGWFSPFQITLPKEPTQ